MALRARKKYVVRAAPKGNGRPSAADRNSSRGLKPGQAETYMGRLELVVEEDRLLLVHEKVRDQEGGGVDGRPTGTRAERDVPGLGDEVDQRQSHRDPHHQGHRD